MQLTCITFPLMPEIVVNQRTNNLNFSSLMAKPIIFISNVC